MEERRTTLTTILNRLELHNINEQMEEGRPTFTTILTGLEEVLPTS